MAQSVFWSKGTLKSVLLAGPLIVLMPAECLAWGAIVKVCNDHPSRGLDVAFVTQQISIWNALMTIPGSWKRQGWWTIPARTCKRTVDLPGTSEVKVWVRVQASDKESMNLRRADYYDFTSDQFCVSEEVFTKLASAMSGLQNCSEGEALERFQIVMGLREQDYPSYIDVTIRLKFAPDSR